MQRQNRANPRILFVACTPLQTNPSTGVDQRMRILHDALATIGQVDFFQPAPPVVARKRRTRALGAMRDDATRKAALYPHLPLHRLFAPGVTKFAEVRPESYDVVLLHRLAASWWTGWTDSKRTIVDIDDIPSQIIGDRMRRGTALLALPRAFLYLWARHNERRALRHFRFGLVCSERDRRYLNHAKAVVVPNAYWKSAALADTESPAISSDMLFVGSLGYPPNAEGLEWFVGQALPLVRRAVPDASLTVIGHLPSDQSRLKWATAPGVHLVGPVDDVVPYVRGCRFEICPLLRGQGTRIKILESLAYGKAVVATTIGSYGLELGDEHGVFQRDDARSFAAVCAGLLGDDARASRLASVGQRKVIQDYSANAVELKLRNLVDRILQGS